jgi:AmmeMemoRadiSam system protein A
MASLPDDIAPQELARLTVESFIGEGQAIAPPASPQGVLAERAGAFVTLRTTGNRLRGCMGTLAPTCKTVAEEVIQNAISAATRDPRFRPVTADELPHLTYSVDVLSAPEPARGPEDLDPSRYGVIIETIDGNYRSLLLPKIERVDTAEEQWRAVHAKAGIRVGTPVRVQRFTATRFGKD